MKIIPKKKIRKTRSGQTNAKVVGRKCNQTQSEFKSKINCLNEKKKNDTIRIFHDQRKIN